jgi:D-aminoacyl-tRNA deacylase
MRIVVQRVRSAQVEVDGKMVGSIGPGALVLLGVTHGDDKSKAAWLASKLVNLRMFEDEQGKMNRSLIDIKGSALIVSQFTLYGDCSEGRRPSFTGAALPNVAEPLYEAFIEEVKKLGLPVATGIFGAYMQVSLVNDGPVTFIIDSK